MCIRDRFTHFLVEALATGEADLNGDGNISFDELYQYVRERVIEQYPQQRPKKKEDVDGGILIAWNSNWKFPARLAAVISSPLPTQRLSAPWAQPVLAFDLV